MHKGELFLGTRFLNNQSPKLKTSKESEKWGFEIQQGVASIFREKKKNEISARKYNVYDFLPKIIMRFFWRIGNFVFLIFAIIMLSLPSFPSYQIWLEINFVSIMLIIYISCEIYSDLQRSYFDNKVNNQKTTKGGKKINEDLETNVLWKDLDVGDIIYLQKEETCPADIIILDTSEIYEREAICYVDTSCLDGSISFVKKKASSLSQITNRLPSKNNYKEYRKSLSGKIEYLGPNSNINEFVGYFRLKKDPKVETLSIDNFIPRGTTLKNVDWVFGLVVFSGFDTKIMLNSNYKRYKISYIEYLSQIYILISALVVFFFAIINTIAVIARVKAYNIFILYPNVVEADPNIDDTSKFIQYLLIYSPLMPLFLYGFLDLVNCFQKFLIEYKINRVNREESCKILDPMPFINISQAKYALFDKTGTLTTSNYRINHIFYNSKLYKIRIDPKSILENISEQEKIRYFSSPFKNTLGKGEILFANNLLLSVNNKDLSIISTSTNNNEINNTSKAPKKFLTKIDESQIDQEDISIHSEHDQINEIHENNVFSFKRNIEQLNNDEITFENSDIDHQKRSTTEIVKRLLGQIPITPKTQAPEFRIQLPELYQTQNLAKTENKAINNKQYEILNNSLQINNDNSQISFRGKEENNESFPLKKNFQSPPSSNRLQENNPYYYMFHNERDFLQDLLKNNSDQNLDSLFEALTLCHSARTQTNSMKIVCAKREDEVILDFSKKCYFVFDKTDNPENPTQYYFKYKTQKLVYNIFGINDPTPKKKSFSVVYKSPINDELYIICKGEEDYMRGLISMTKKELEIYDFLIRDMQNQGLKPIVYARKPLSISQTQDYNNKMKNLKSSLITQTEEVINLGKNLENNMELLCIIGLKDELNEGVEETVDFLEQIGVNMWMVTGDCKENAVSSAIAAKICNPLLQKPKEIIQEDEHNIDVVIRNYINEVKNFYNAIKTQIQNEAEKKGTLSDHFDKSGSKLSKQMSTYLFRLRSERNGPSFQTQNQKIFSELRKKMFGFYFILNGKSLEIIIKDSFLKAHLVFLLSLVKNTIAYNMSPEMKACLVSMIQNNFVGSPSVLAVGDSYNDAIMLQKADMGIELIKKGSIEKRAHAGDIQITSLKLLKPLMLNEGVLRITLLENLVFFLFYQSSLVGISLFLFYWFSALTLDNLYYSLLIFFYFLLFSSPNILIYAIFDRPIKDRILNVFPGLYCEGSLKKRFIMRRFIFKSLMDAFFHSLVIFYVCLYVLRTSNIQDGRTSGLNTCAFAIILVLILVNNIKILIKSLMHRNKLILLSFCFTIVFLVFFFLISIDVEKSWMNWSVEIRYMLSNLLGLMLIIGVVLICLLISYISENYIYKIFVPSLYTTFANERKMGHWSELSNDKIVSYYEIASDIGSYIKDIFSNVETLDPTIQEMFTPADINVNEIELNKYSLVIQQKTIENKYNFLTKRDHVSKASLFFLLLIIIFGIYSITILIIRKNKDFGFISLGIFFLTLLLWFVTLSDFYKKSYYGYTSFVILLGASAKLALDWVGNPVYISLGAVLIPHISTTNLNLGIIFVFGINASYFISFFVCLLCIYYQKYPMDMQVDDLEISALYELFLNKLIIFYSVWNYIIYISCINIICFYGLYKFEKLKRSEFLAKSRIENEANNVQDILAILVPKFVKDRLSHGDISMQEVQDDVGILFCDICDFDKIINTEGTKIVEMLDEIFRNFDHLCLKHGIQKIETVGKTYMACAGLASCEIQFSSQILKTEKTRRLVSMALEMVKYIQNITYGKGEHIKLKIGIHNGRVISGVIGYHKPQFSLIGDTVNTTSRVCSTGVDGSITLSEEAFENIKNSNINCEQRVVQAKGKGDLVTYQVLNQKKAKKKKESKLKKKINEHMPAIREAYEKMKAENKRNLADHNKNQAATYNKAVNLMSTWLVHKKLENKEEDHMFFNDKSAQAPLEQEKSLQNDASNVIQMMESQFHPRDDIFKDNLRLKNTIFLTFDQDQTALAQDFLHLLFQKHKQESRISLFMLIPIYLINTFLMIVIQKEIENSNFLLIFRGGYAILLSIYLFYVMSHIKDSQWNRVFFVIIYIYGIISTFLFIRFTASIFLHQVGLLEMVFIYLIFINSNFLKFVEVLGLTLLSFILFLIFFLEYDIMNEKNFFFVFTVFLYNLFKIHYQIRYHIQSFNTILINEAKKEEQNSLVSQLLPLHAFEKLKHVSVTNKIELTDFFENVTILFADIAGFTKYSSSVRPEDVVNMLRKLFTEFDKQCLKHKVYKVYTIGDCYVVLGFLNANYRNPLEEAKNVVRMGLSMIEIIRTVRQIVNFPSLDMRIGVHTGDIIGGIIGTDIVRYDIYGKDVLIANKMESNGVEGNIMVSESTKKLLEKDENLNFSFHFHKPVECKVQIEPINGYLLYQKEYNNMN